MVLKKIVLSSEMQQPYNKNNNTSSPPCGPKLYLSKENAENIIYTQLIEKRIFVYVYCLIWTMSYVWFGVLITLFYTNNYG